MKNLIKFLSLVIISSLIFSGCSKEDKGLINITVTDNGGDSQKLHNEIAKVVVEHGYDGYQFSTSNSSSTMNWQSVISGDIDLDIESWTDNVASYKDDIKNGDIVDVGVLIPDSKQGLYVPRYIIEGDSSRSIEAVAPDLKTVKDLLKYPEVFPDYENKGKGIVYGGLPGWMADEILFKKYEAYNLNEKYNYKRLGDESSLFASAMSAYNLGEGWVGYCYEPTWITGKLDLVLLEDEPYDDSLYLDGLCEFSSQELKIVSSNKFAEKAPDLLEFFQKYETGNDLISNALAHMEDTGENHEETAKWLLKNNESLLDEWMPKEQADNVKEYLNK